MKIKRFEDLQAWKEARALVSEIYRAVRLSDSLKQDRRFRDQITSAAVSVMSNVAEGFSRRSDREFTQYLFIAKGSCAEVQSLLYVALDQEYINHTEFEALYAQAEKSAKLLSGLITYLLTSSKRGKAPKVNTRHPRTKGVPSNGLPDAPTRSDTMDSTNSTTPMDPTDPTDPTGPTDPTTPTDPTD